MIDISIQASDRFAALLLAVPVLSFLGAILVVLFANSRFRNICRGYAVGVSMAVTAIAISLLVHSIRLGGKAITFGIFQAGSPLVWLPIEGFPVGSVAFQFRAEAIMLWLFSGFSLVVTLSLIAEPFRPNDISPTRRVAKTSALPLGILGSLSLVALTTDGVIFFMFWQLTALIATCCFMGGFKNRAENVAAHRWFLFSLGCDLFLLLGMFCLWNSLGTTQLGPWNSTSLEFGQAENSFAYQNLFAASVILACCCRAGLFPFLGFVGEFSNRSRYRPLILMTGVVFPSGLFLLFRLLPLLSNIPEFRWGLITVGICTSVLTSFIALTKRSLSELFPWFCCGLIGLTFVGLGCGNLSGFWGAVILSVVQAILLSSISALITTAHVPTLEANEQNLPLQDWMDLRSLPGVFIVSAVLLLMSGLAGQALIFGSVSSAFETESWAAARSAVVFSLCLLAHVLMAYSLFRSLLIASRNFQRRRPQTISRRNSQAILSRSLPYCLILCMGILLIVVNQPTMWMHHFPRGFMSDLDSGHLTFPLNVEPFMIVICSFLTAMAAILAWMTSSGDVNSRSIGQAKFPRMSRFVEQTFSIDKLWDILVLKPVRTVAHFLRFCEWFVIDVVISNTVPRLPRSFRMIGNPLRQASSSFYALSVLLATALLLAVLIWPVLRQ